MRSTKRCLVFGFAVAGLLILAARAAHSPPSTGIRPRYTDAGLLEVPQRFRSWVFVGADLSPQYKPDVAETAPAEKDRSKGTKHDAFHNVYINPESYDAYLKTGQFPDPTILVMEVLKAEEKDAGGILASGQFEGKRVGLEAAVKDKSRPGGGVPWAYYSFELDKSANPVQPAKAFPDASCYECHLKHASNDNVWVQFYPALRDPQ